MDLNFNKSALNDLKAVTRDQLHNYPNIKTKRYIKLLIKNIIKRKSIKINDKFFWPNGLLATSLEWSHRNIGNEEDIQSLKAYYNRWIQKGIPIKNADYTINGYTLIYLYEITNDKKYLNAIEFLVDYLKNHIHTDIGSLPYREFNKTSVFVDSLGMICPFLCRYGNLSNDHFAIDLGIKQLTNFLEFGMDKESRLPYHGYNSNSHIKLGIIGWGRAVGWLLIGLVDSLEYIPNSHPKYKLLCDELSNIVIQVLKYQNNNGAFSWQITAKEGYMDSSSTSMISYAIRRGIMLEILPERYLKNTNTALDLLFRTTCNGFVQDCSAECLDFGMYPQSYGNYPWAQGPTTSLAAISNS